MKRRKIANYLKVGILYLGIYTLLWNCEKDKNSIVENTFKKKYDIISISANEVEGLTSYIKKSGKKVTQYRRRGKYLNRSVEDLNLDLERVIQVTDSLGYQSHTLTILNPEEKTFERLLLTKEGDTYIPSIYQYKPNSGWFVDGKAKSILRFSGEIIKYNAEGEIIFERILENGVVTNNPTNNTFARTSSTECCLETFYEDEDGDVVAPPGDDDAAECFTLVYEWNCTGSGCGGGNDSTGTGDTNSPTGGDNDNSGTGSDENSNSDGGSGSSTGGNTNNNNSNPTDNLGMSLTEAETALSEIYSCFDGSGGLNPILGGYLSSQTDNRGHNALALQINNFIDDNGGCSAENNSFIELGLQAEIDGAEVDWENKIISELIGKEKCLNTHLKEKGNNFVKNILNKFEGDDSEFSINISSKDKVYKNENGINVEVGGLTTYTSNSSILKIQISTSYASSRKALQVVRTIIHEYIHADMFRKLETTNPTSGDLDFRKVYNNFEKNKFKASSQHQTMAQLYVNEIKNTLKNFHKEVLVGDYNYLTNNGSNPLPDSFYEAIAWEGLKEHDVKAYLDLPQTKKDELKNSLISHIHSTTTNCPN